MRKISIFVSNYKTDETNNWLTDFGFNAQLL